MSTADTSSKGAAPPRRFGRFELRQPVGKSLASNTWLAFDPQAQAEVLLCVPRAQPATPTAREEWTQDVLKASRLRHPHLAEVLDLGVIDGWPFAAYERKGSVTLGERLQPGQGQVGVLDQVRWVNELLEGLAYAHDAGVSHRDLSLHNVLLDGQGHVRLAGLGVGLATSTSGDAGGAVARHEHRSAAERDVLMVGLLMYRLLAGVPALDDGDLGHAASRVGLEIVRLPWTTPQPVEETLRAIVNRAVDRQQRQRYLNARTLLSALQGWVKTHSQESAGPLALFLDRIEAVGHLPSRSADLGGLLKVLVNDHLRIDDVVDQLVRDPALCWELLRVVNQQRRRMGSEEITNSPGRAMTLLGEQGLRKVAASLRTWPGVLGASASLQGQAASDQAVTSLELELKRACIAAITARWLRPFNIGDEDAMMAAMSQRLGHLLIQYHYPEEHAQIARLMASVPPTEPGGRPTPGMSLEAATGAVLGIHPDELTGEVLRHWGFAESLVQAARPLGPQQSPHRPDSPDDWLRLTACLANELVGLVDMHAAIRGRALTQIVSRFARPSLTTQQEMLEALARGLRAVDRNLFRQVFPPKAPAEPAPGAAPAGSRATASRSH